MEESCPRTVPRELHRLRERVRGAVRAVVAVEPVPEGVRVLLRPLQLRAAGHRREPRRLPLLRRHHHPRRPPQVPLTYAWAREAAARDASPLVLCTASSILPHVVVCTYSAVYVRVSGARTYGTSHMTRLQLQCMPDPTVFAWIVSCSSFAGARLLDHVWLGCETHRDANFTYGFRISIRYLTIKFDYTI